MAIGALGWIGAKTEATAGTGESTVNIFFPTEQFTAVQSHEPVEVNANLASMTKLGYLKGKLTPKGSLTAPLSAKTATVFYWALGNVSSADNGDGTHTHTITPALTLPTFTVHADEVIGKVAQAGAKISKLTVSATAGEVAKISVEWLAMSHTDDATFTETPDFETEFMNFTEAIITLNGTQMLTVDNIELTFDNKVEALFTLGTGRYPHEVMRNDRPDYTGKIALIDWDSTLYQKMINADDVSITFTLTDPNGNYVKITLPKVQFTGGFEPTIGTGRITAEPEFVVVGDSPVSVEIKNTLASL
jgi:hypothetical protein